MNRGPFTIKKHVLITIFVNYDVGSVYATHILTIVKLLYKRQLIFILVLLIMVTIQVNIFLSTFRMVVCFCLWF